MVAICANAAQTTNAPFVINLGATSTPARNQTVNGNLAVATNATIAGTLTVSGNATVHGVLAVDGSVFSSGATLNAFGGSSVFSGPVTELAKGWKQSSNTYPITAWSSLGNCGCITWMSNATLYLICTNSINSSATTNKLGGL